MGQSDHYTIKKASFSTDKYNEFSPVFYKQGVVYCTDRDQGLFSYSGTGDKSFFELYYVDTTGDSRRWKPELFSK